MGRAAFSRNGCKTNPPLGIKEAEVGPLALSGTYTIRLTIDGQTYTQPLTIVKDPKNLANDLDLETSFKMQLQIRDDISKTADAVNRIEWMRKQISVLEAMARSEGKKGRDDEKDGGDKDQQDKDQQEKDKPDKSDDKSNPNAALLKSLQGMDQKMQSVEYKFISGAEALSDDKYYSSADKIYLNLIWLNAEVGTGGGDVAGGTGFGPTETSITLLQMIEKDLAAAENEVQTLLEKDVPEFNRSLVDRRITPLSVSTILLPQPRKKHHQGSWRRRLSADVKQCDPA